MCVAHPLSSSTRTKAGREYRRRMTAILHVPTADGMSAFHPSRTLTCRARLQTQPAYASVVPKLLGQPRDCGVAVEKWRSVRRGAIT
jgi:hypothetical protein